MPQAATAAKGDSGTAGPQNPAGTFAGTIEPVERPRPDLNPAVLRDVRAAQHPDFERVVFEFQPPSVPGYRMEYAEAPVLNCGAGEPLNVEGVAHLVVRLSPAQAHTEAGEVTVRDRERRPALEMVRELELSCDFEGQVSWVVGLSARRPYRVSELAAPPRLVVDIQR